MPTALAFALAALALIVAQVPSAPAGGRQSPAPGQQSSAGGRQGPAPGQQSSAARQQGPAPGQPSPAAGQQSPAPAPQSPAPGPRGPAPVPSATPEYHFVFRPSPSPDATAFPGPNPPGIAEIDLSDTTLVTPGIIRVRVLTTDAVVTVTAETFGSAIPVPKRQTGLFSLEGYVPAVPDGFKNRSYDVHFVASAADGRTASVVLPLTLK